MRLCDGSCGAVNQHQGRGSSHWWFAGGSSTAPAHVLPVGGASSSGVSRGVSWMACSWSCCSCLGSSGVLPPRPSSSCEARSWRCAIMEATGEGSAPPDAAAACVKCVRWSMPALAAAWSRGHLLAGGLLAAAWTAEGPPLCAAAACSSCSCSSSELASALQWFGTCKFAALAPCVY